MTSVERDLRHGGLSPTAVDPNLYQDVQTTLSRLIGKADQLPGNCTADLAECWMHIRTNLTGGT